MAAAVDPPAGGDAPEADSVAKRGQHEDDDTPEADRAALIQMRAAKREPSEDGDAPEADGQEADNPFKTLTGARAVGTDVIWGWR